MGNRANYLKVIMEITNKASKTYTKYQEYKTDPGKFKENEANLFFTFQIADNLLRTAKDYLSGTKNNILENGSFNNLWRPVNLTGKPGRFYSGKFAGSYFVHYKSTVGMLLQNTCRYLLRQFAFGRAGHNTCLHSPRH